MDRRASKILVFGLLSSILATGCTPQQPFFVNEDGDLSHLLTKQTDLVFPDVESAKSWFTSEEYQAIIPLRDEASDMSLVLHEVPS